MEIGIIVAVVSAAIALIGLYFRFEQEKRDKERHAIEVAKEKDRLEDKQKQEESNRRRIKLDEQNYWDGIKDWEREGGKLAGSFSPAMQDIAEKYEKELENLRSDFRSRGMEHTGFLIDAEEALLLKRRKEEADFLTAKNEKEILLQQKRLMLDRDYRRIMEEKQKYGIE